MFKVDCIKCLPIEGEKVTLRQFTESDIQDSYISWLNDSDVVKFSNQRFKHHSIDTCKDYYHSFSKGENLFLAIIFREEKCMVGTLTIYFSPNHNVADVGIMIGDKRYWGTGIGFDAWNSVVSFLLNEVGVRKVTGGALSCNTGMVNIMKKTGMLEDGVRKKQEAVNGKFFDIVHFAKYKNDK